jgi:hypothetical protein
MTDEELAILSGDEGIVISPFLGTMDPRERKAVMRTAYRGMLARGLVNPPTPEAQAEAIEQRTEDGTYATVELAVRQDVQAMVTLRNAATTVVAAARTTAVSQDFWYAHVVDDVVLIEEVSSDGLHRFALERSAALPDLVEAACIHPEAGNATGDVIEWRPLSSEDPTPPTEIVEKIGEALVRCDLTVRFVGDENPPMLGLFTGPNGSWMLHSHEDSRRPVSVVPSTASDLRDEVRRSVVSGIAQSRANG